MQFAGQILQVKAIRVIVMSLTAQAASWLRCLRVAVSQPLAPQDWQPKEHPSRGGWTLKGVGRLSSWAPPSEVGLTGIALALRVGLPS